MSISGRSRSAPEYLRALYGREDWVAVVAVERGVPRGESRVVQRIVPAGRAAGEPFQRWLRHLNAQRHDIFVSMNPLDPSRRRREKEDVKEVRRLQLDLDERGPESLRRLVRDIRRGEVPPPALVTSSSHRRYQAVWHVSPGWTAEAAEGTMKGLAVRYGGDRSVADVARVMRLPGFRNKKSGRADFLATWTDHGGPPADRCAFASVGDVGTEHPAVSRGRPPKRARSGRISQSERDWAFVRGRLRGGVSEEELIAELQDRRRDKPDPGYYARRTVRRAVESLRWPEYFAVGRT